VPLQPGPDAALVERMIAGDESALSTLYDRYSSMLFSMLVRILKDTSAAEEILQDLFLQLWRNPSRFDPSRGSLPAWLLVIGRNRAISRLRSRERREVSEDSEGFSMESIPSPGNIEEEAQRSQLAQRLKSAMATLPPEQREAVELAYFEGMSQTEIATRTGSPLGTVKSRVRTAMQSLKQIFGDGTAPQSGRL
jgi:RNA polymerase sigma-70 factor, ECF subfamily